MKPRGRLKDRHGPQCVEAGKAPGKAGFMCRRARTPLRHRLFSGARERKIQMGIFRREITFDIDEGEGGRLFIQGTLRDTRLDQPIHLIEVRAEIGIEDGRIYRLQGEMPHVPNEECRFGLQTLAQLVGERIVPGFTQLVRDVVGSSQGCTHLSVLVTNLGHVSVQGRAAVAMSATGGGEKGLRLLREQGLEMGLMNGCYVWREDGALMKQIREEMRGSEE